MTDIKNPGQIRNLPGLHLPREGALVHTVNRQRHRTGQLSILSRSVASAVTVTRTVLSSSLASIRYVGFMRDAYRLEELAGAIRNRYSDAMASSHEHKQGVQVHSFKAVSLGLLCSNLNPEHIQILIYTYTWRGYESLYCECSRRGDICCYC